jgi:hypothetical protein
MIEALKEGDTAFLEEMFLEMREEYHLQEWLVVKEDTPLYHFGTPLFRESLLTSVKPQTLEVIFKDGNFYLAQKVPLLYEDGTPSGYYALLGIDNVEILHLISPSPRDPREFPLRESTTFEKPRQSEAFSRILWYETFFFSPLSWWVL